MNTSRENRSGRRFDCRLDGTCEYLEGSPPFLVSCPATVMNMSTTGLALLSTRKIEHGAMLFVKIPDPTRTFWCGRSVRVTHAVEQLGHFHLGGEFTAPLSTGELETLLGHKAAPERRLNPRFVPSPETLERLEVKLAEHDLLVILRDISAAGICLVSPRSFAEGTRLRVELTNHVSGAKCTVVCRLLHVRPAGEKWRLGGALTEKIPNQVLLTLLS